MKPAFLALLICFWATWLLLCFALRDRDRAERANDRMRRELMACGSANTEMRAVCHEFAGRVE